MIKGMINRILLPLVLCLFTGCLAGPGAGLEPGKLLCEQRPDPLGIASLIPRLSWKNSAEVNGASQSGYRILAASSLRLLDQHTGDLWDSGKVESGESIMIPWAGRKLASRSLVYWKVRTWDQDGIPSGWSSAGRFSVGLLGSEDWEAEYVGLSPDDGDPDFPQLRNNFMVEDAVEHAFLHVNSLGYHEAYINSLKADDSVLTPAVSQMDKRTFVNTYDVTHLLQQGKNTLAFWLGEGWFSDGLPGVDYPGPLVRAQLEVMRSGEWETALITGKGWKARPSEITGIGAWRSGRYGGERVDARRSIDAFASAELDAGSWPDAAVVEIPPRPAVPQKTELNRIRETISPVDIREFGGRNTWLVDFGKNLTGWVEIDLSDLKTGQEVEMEFSDFFIEKGKLKDQGQRDIYIAGPQERQVFRNRFNYHGFRYMKIRKPGEMPSMDSIRAYLIHTDYQIASSFESSDQDLNLIHDMIFYTLQCLSLGGYLVDCPQIERLGYGGDGNASTPTAQTMFDLGPLYSTWLDHWADCIRPDGGMPHTAPNPYPAGGGPYWCGFIITAAWNTYMNYGDLRVLEEHYPVMKQWLGYVDQYSEGGLLKPWPETDYRAWYLGDWASPEGIDDKHPESIDLIANSYLVVCLDTMARIAAELGREEEASGFSKKRDELKTIVHKSFYNGNSGLYADGDQTDLAFPLIAGIVPDELLETVTGNLKKNIIEKNRGHLATGLVGVPVITEWATEGRSADLMYSMLKSRGYPGYLHMIENGATTTWEHWDGARSHIHNCFNGVGSWFYQAAGGIMPLEGFPAYRRFLIDPQVPEGLGWVRAEKATPYGRILVSWEATDGNMMIEASVPVGTEAEVRIPEGAESVLVNGSPASPEELFLQSGSHRIEWRF